MTNLVSIAAETLRILEVISSYVQTTAVQPGSLKGLQEIAKGGGDEKSRIKPLLLDIRPPPECPKRIYLDGNKKAAAVIN